MSWNYVNNVYPVISQVVNNDEPCYKEYLKANPVGQRFPAGTGSRDLKNDADYNEWVVGIMKPDISTSNDRRGTFALIDTIDGGGIHQLGLFIDQSKNTIRLGLSDNSRHLIVGDYSTMTAEMQYYSYVFLNPVGGYEYAEISLDGISLPKFTEANRPTLGGSDFKSIYCTDCTATDTSTGVIQTWNGATWKNHW